MSVFPGQFPSCKIAGSKGIYIFNCDCSCFIVLHTGCSNSYCPQKRIESTCFFILLIVLCIGKPKNWPCDTWKISYCCFSYENSYASVYCFLASFFFFCKLSTEILCQPFFLIKFFIFFSLVCGYLLHFLKSWRALDLCFIAGLILWPGKTFIELTFLLPFLCFSPL